MEPDDRIGEQELRRILLWRQDLIDSLGPDLKAVVVWVHEAGGDVSPILRLAYRIETRSVTTMGIRLLWEQLEREKQEKREHQDPEKEQGVVG